LHKIIGQNHIDYGHNALHRSILISFDPSGEVIAVTGFVSIEGRSLE